MPYISEKERPQAEYVPNTSGELNYAITKLMVNFVQRKGLSYTTINDCMGAVSGAGLEFYRRVAVPYEDNKCEENGDVYAGVFSTTSD
jgi:hypothetical protein